MGRGICTSTSQKSSLLIFRHSITCTYQVRSNISNEIHNYIPDEAGNNTLDEVHNNTPDNVHNITSDDVHNNTSDNVHNNSLDKAGNNSLDEVQNNTRGQVHMTPLTCSQKVEKPLLPTYITLNPATLTDEGFHLLVNPRVGTFFRTQRVVNGGRWYICYSNTTLKQILIHTNNAARRFLKMSGA
ncbi:hypothetical protein RRG08_018328 [Elysia crispata]|uniref:Uncharacterized protein n=1 Tax=Elysia crispata TaxID=231223 RepID=A0AAE0ZMH0_9GAST|nr:hypothetical protein RRG08_018328 [Elysia crispata]